MAAKPIEIEDYYDKVHQATWPRRTAGLIGGAMVGIVVGGIIGAVAAFLPFIFGAIGMAGAAPVTVGAALSAVPGTAALFAGMAGLMLSAAMAAVGSDVAATSYGLAEKERREKLADQPGHSGETKIIPPAKQPVPQMFNWKVAMITAPLAAVFGALISLHPATASTISYLGFQGATQTATASIPAIAASASIFGMMGSLLGLKMSYISNKASNFAFKIISGKLFESAPEKAIEPTITPVPGRPESEMNYGNKPTRTVIFASEKLKFSLQDRNEQLSSEMLTR